MPPRSKIYKLPQYLQAKIDDLIAKKAVTYKQITEYINNVISDETLKISESCVARYGKQFGETMDNIKAARQAAKLYSDDFEDSDILKMNIEHLSVMTAKVQHRINENLEKYVDQDELKEAVSTLANLANTALRLNVAKKSTQDYDDKKMKMYKDATKEELKNFGIDEEGIKSAISRIYGKSN